MARWCLALVLASALVVHIGAVSLDDAPQQRMERRARREKQAEQWTRGFYTITDGKTNLYDVQMVVCCFLVEKNGIVPHETWGNWSQIDENYWEKHHCNKWAGASVLSVGSPACEYFKALKQGFESTYLRDQPRDPAAAVCSESDRAILNGTDAQKNLKDKIVPPSINLLAEDSDCAPSQVVLSSGRGVNTSKLAGCVKKLPPHAGLSEPCLTAFTGLLHNVIKLRSVDTLEACLDICYGLDTCIGMEKCVKKAASCSRCIEPALYKFKHQVGGETPIVQPDLFMRVVMGFEPKWKY